MPQLGLLVWYSLALPTGIFGICATIGTVVGKRSSDLLPNLSVIYQAFLALVDVTQTSQMELPAEAVYST